MEKVYLLHGMTVWPSGLRRWLKAPFRKGVGSNPTAVNHNGVLNQERECERRVERK